jgi:hypothetical protein
MKITLDIHQETDLQFLLTLLERMQIPYSAIDLPQKKAAKKPETKVEVAAPIVRNIADFLPK